ncbi:putative deoxynucleotide monophosphate kinase [Pseudomonas phage UAntarctica]|nr:putative deoxynucleotide monophosphate kinase [Pseudomonas phage UAntarctica]
MPVSQPLLIGIYGRARSGKDTAADYLAKRLGLYKYAFAEPLKTMLKSVFGDHFHEGDRSGICPETGVSYRVMMQTLGTEWGRALNDNVWVNLVEKKWDWVNKGGWAPGAPDCGGFNGMVLSDIRFDSEAEWVRDHGGMVVHVCRNVEPTPGIIGHVSEQGIRQGLVDYAINNGGTLPEFHQCLESLITKVEG